MYSKGFTFSERVKERLCSPTGYETFLKCLNIYSRGIITREELQILVADLLGKHHDLMEGFNDFLERCERIDSKRAAFRGVSEDRFSFLPRNVIDLFDHPKHDEGTTLERFLSILAPTLEILELDPFFLELLRVDKVLEVLPFTLDCLWDLSKQSLCFDFGELSQTASALQLIKSLPNLSKLQIRVYDTSEDAEEVLEYLDSPACLDQPLDKLKHVLIHFLRVQNLNYFS